MASEPIHHPVEALGDDVLYLIFTNTLPSSILDDDGNINILSISPMNISLVCRAWNAIVTSRPSLWSSICIRHIGFTAMDSRIPWMVSKWLDKSLSSPLDITLKVAVAEKDPSVIAQVLDQIARHSHRLNKFRIFAIDIYPTLDHNPAIFKFPPSMISFALSCEPVKIASTASPVVLDLRPAPAVSPIRLRSLHLTSGSIWRFPDHGTLSFPLLEDLLFSITQHDYFNDIHTILSASPNLLTIYFLVNDRPNVAPIAVAISEARKPIHLPLLHSFAVVTVDAGTLEDIKPILQCLTCPLLKGFVASGHSASAPELLDSFRDFLVRSGMRLESLTLGLRDPPPSTYPHRDRLASALEAMLCKLEWLECLVLRGLVIDIDLVEAMTLSNGGGGICPGLKTLRVSCADDGAFDVHQETIEDMIESRWRPARKLQTLELRMPGLEFIEEKSGRLHAYKQEGLIFLHA